MPATASPPPPVVKIPPYQNRNIAAPDWTGPYFRVCFAGYGRLPAGHPADDLTRATFAGGGGWIYVLSGRLSVREANINREVGTGEALLFTNPTHVTLTYEEPLVCLRLGIYGLPSATMIEWLIQRHGSFHRLRPASAPVRLARVLFAEAARRSFRPPRIWAVLAYDWFVELAREIETHPNCIVEPRHEIVKNSCLLGLRHRSFKSFAHAMGYNPAYLSRSIKKSWGNESPARLLRLGRLKQAAELLRATNLPVTKIATHICYARASSFGTAFRTAFGLSPLRYRHAHRLGHDLAKPPGD